MRGRERDRDRRERERERYIGERERGGRERQRQRDRDRDRERQGDRGKMDARRVLLGEMTAACRRGHKIHSQYDLRLTFPSPP